MANATRYGFKPVMKGFGIDPNPRKYPATSAATIAIGDAVIIDSAGRVSVATAASSTELLGVAASAVTSATEGDPIYVWDNPDMLFEAMASTGALADSYTTRSRAACFDLAGTTGEMYVNAAASSEDLFKCIGECAKDPSSGADSAVGSNQMKYWKISSGAHVYGTIA